MKKLTFIMVLMMAGLATNAQQRTPFKVSDLQKPITDNIAKSYPGFAIKDATKIMNMGVTSYEVVIDKGTTSETLLYDNNGNFLRKEKMKSGMAGKSSSKERSGSQHMAHRPLPKKK